MRSFKTLLLALCVGFSLLVAGCDNDDYDYNNGDVTQPSTSRVSKPSFEKYLTTTTYEEVSFRCRFANGGDTWENMGCTVHWREYRSKPSTVPKASDMTKHETMRIYATTSRSTTFDKTHTGFSGGTYVYYYFECHNSKYRIKTNVTHCVVKR